MLKQSIISILAFSLSICPALALDYAKREVLGFSQDGNYFAFEQYGSQDGSGFAYSDIFIIDTRTDSWIAGSPYRYLLKDESETLSMLRGIEKARTINRTAAHSALTMITDPGVIAASNMVDETSADPYSLSISPRSFFLPGNVKRMKFRIEPIVLPAPQHCLDYNLDSEFAGFRLLRTGTGNTLVSMHEDTSIPESRNCPLDYQPSDIVVHSTGAGKFTVAVLIRMQQLGFEGPDRRFIAVTGALN